MKKVLWVSRHQMTWEQRADLERIMGGPVELIPRRETVRQAAELADDLERADAAAVVLPPVPLAGGDKKVFSALKNSAAEASIK